MSAAHDTPTGTDRQHATRGVALVLERMTVDEWDALMAGEIGADDLRAKYLPGAETEQADLGRWNA